MMVGIFISKYDFPGIYSVLQTVLSTFYALLSQLSSVTAVETEAQARLNN